MPWVLQFDKSNEPPEFQMGRWPDWKECVPEISERAKVSDAFHKGGEPIDLDKAPHRLEVESPLETLPPAFRSCDGVKIVTREIKEKIDSIGSTGIQMYPIRISSPGDVVDDRAWYVLNAFAEKKSIIRDKSSVKPHFAYKDTWKVAYIDHQAPDRQMLLTPAALEGPHLWREAGYPRSMFMSDELKTLFDDAGLVFFNSWHADVNS